VTPIRRRVYCALLSGACACAGAGLGRAWHDGDTVAACQCAALWLVAGAGLVRAGED
jgi:hypothetical protein